MAAVWIARDRGLFKKYGLDVQYILMPRSPLAVSALVAGEIDMAVIGPGHLVNAAAGGTDVIGIANFAQNSIIVSTRDPRSRKRKSFAVNESLSAAPALHLIWFRYWRCSTRASIRMQPRSLFLRFRALRSTADWHFESGSIDATALNGSVGDLYGQKGYPGAVQFQRLGGDDAANHARHPRRLALTKPQVVDAYAKTIVEAIAVMFDPSQQRKRHTHHRFQLAPIQCK